MIPGDMRESQALIEALRFMLQRKPNATGNEVVIAAEHLVRIEQRRRRESDPDAYDYGAMPQPSQADIPTTPARGMEVYR